MFRLTEQDAQSAVYGGQLLGGGGGGQLEDGLLVVRQALEAVPGVREAAADAEAGTALVLLDEDVPDDILKKAVEAEEYTVINIQKK